MEPSWSRQSNTRCDISDGSVFAKRHSNLGSRAASGDFERIPFEARTRRRLNEHFLAKIGCETAEDGPSKVWGVSLEPAKLRAADGNFSKSVLDL